MEKKPFDRSAHMRAMNAKRTPESFAKSFKKRSESMKKAWAKKGPLARIEVNRKISASLTKRHSEIPPRMKKDQEKNRINGIINFYNKDTINVQEHKEYLGYLSRKDILECPLEKKECIVAKRTAGQQASWDRLTPQEREERCNKTLGVGNKKKRKIHLLYETDVPRKKDYCGVVTEKEMESMHG